MSQEVKYYLIQLEIDFCAYMVKGTYDAAHKFAIARLKDTYNIKKPSDVHANNYDQLFYIVEYDDDSLIEMIEGSDFGAYYPEMDNENWILEHKDDFYTILNEDGTIAKEHIY